MIEIVAFFSEALLVLACDKSRGGYCENTHPFTEIKLLPSLEIDRGGNWK